MQEVDGRTRGFGAPPQSPNTLVRVSDELPSTSTVEKMQSGQGQGRPFAWLPLIAIAFCLAANTVALSSLSTYMGVCVQQLLDLPSPNASGYYASWLAGAFTVGNVVSTYPWGYFADRFGRKPVMVFGLFACGVLSLTFGLSTTFAEAMVSRFLFGLANSMIPIARIMAVELLGPEHAVMGMAFLPGSRAVGSIIGPVIGGVLAQPAVLYPSTFSPTGLFARYPFLLPNLAVAFLAFSCLPFVVYHLPETLNLDSVIRGERASSGGSSAFTESGAGDIEIISSSNIPLVARVKNATISHRGPPHLPEQADPSDDSKLIPRTASPIAQAKQTHDSSCGTENGRNKEESESLFVVKRKHGTGLPVRDGGGSSESPRRERVENYVKSSPWCGPGGLLSSWRVRWILVLQCFIAAEVVSFDQVYPLWLLATKDTGGLQWSMPKIGKVLGWAGVGVMLFQFALYPALCRTLGIVRLVRLAGVVAVLALLIAPDIQHTSWSERNSYVVGVTLVVLIQSCASVMEIASTLASANAVPANMRGKFGGIFSMAGSLGRVIAPPTLSSLLAWSLESTHPSGSGDRGVDYHLVFVLQAIMVVVILLLGLRAFTLVSMTIPIGNRRANYEPFPLIDDKGLASSDGVAEEAIAVPLESGRRRALL